MKSVEKKREEKKLLQDLREQYLGSASAAYDATTFESNYAKARADGISVPLNSPGYYAIAVYKLKPGKNNLAGYEEIFVGRSENMGDSVHSHLAGTGNPDVYADYKYKRPMQIYAFPDFDEEDDNNETLGQMIVALGAYESYNERAIAKWNDEYILMSVSAVQGLFNQVVGALATQFEQVEVREREMCGHGFIEGKLRVK